MRPSWFTTLSSAPLLVLIPPPAAGRPGTEDLTFAAFEAWWTRVARPADGVAKDLAVAAEFFSGGPELVLHRQVSHGLQLQSLWIIPNAAVG